MDVKFFKPFIDGTQNTLKVQCNLDCVPLKPFIKSKEKDITFDIAGVIGLASSSFTGTIALCFPKSVFLELMNYMLGEKFTEITDDLQDGAAELLNIIFGQAKIVLNENNCRIDKAIPTVVRGTGMRTQHLSNCPVFVLPFETKAGVFFIEIVAEDRAQAA